MIHLYSGKRGEIEKLKPAFRRCKNDFEIMKTEIAAGRVSVYRVVDENHDLLIAGEIVGKSYFLWAVVGRGVVSGLTELTHYVINAGLESMTAETFFDGLPRLCKKLKITTVTHESGVKSMVMGLKNGR